MEAKFHKTYESFVKSGKGSLFLSNNKKYFLVKCPGCKMELRLPINNKKGWSWIGNLKEPTLSPSILHMKEGNGCGWHGWLTAGIWKAS